MSKPLKVNKSPKNGCQYYYKINYNYNYINSDL